MTSAQSLFLVSVVSLAISACSNRANYGPSKASEPSYGAWNQIEIGMPIDRARSILGEPISEITAKDLVGISNADDFDLSMRYGVIEFNHPSLVSIYTFELTHKNGLVTGKYNPFGQDAAFKLPENGFPTTPIILGPSVSSPISTFAHEVDLRWLPSAGEMPIKYELEIDFGISGDAIPSDPYPTYRCAIPYLCLGWPGPGNNGKWRVRAINGKGDSNWSGWNAIVH